jgi:hypothetical protein
LVSIGFPSPSQKARSEIFSPRPQPDSLAGAAGRGWLEQRAYADVLYRKTAGGQRETQEGINEKIAFQEGSGVMICLNPAETTEEKP